MNSRVFLLKPCRTTDHQPSLDHIEVKRNWSIGIETCVVLDLNVLNRFKEHVARVDHLEPQLLGDVEAIKSALEVPHLYVTPGFALGEADEAYLDVLVNSFESFLARELPGYLDAANAIPHEKQEGRRARRYTALPVEERQLLSTAYLSLLKIHDILLKERHASPECRFDLFLEFMDRVANFVPAIEIEVAKHCFFDSTRVIDENFLKRSRLIKANFDKKGSGQTRVDRILNGARDITYLRATAARDGKPLDGRTQDTWLLTCDAGIAALNELVYFHPVEGERAKYMTTSESTVRQKDSYWRYVDRTSRELLSSRVAERKRRGDEGSAEQQLKVIAALAQELGAEVARHAPLR
jgi:hypothetical protein